MANTPVQVGGDTLTTSGTTLTATNDTLIPANSTIILVVSHGGSGLLTSAASSGLTWQVDGAIDTSGFLLGVGAASTYNSGADIAIGALSVTATLTATTTRKGWKLLSVPGIRPNRVDVVKTDTDNPTPVPSTPPLTPTQNGDVLISAFAVNSLLQADGGWSAGAGWTKCGFEAPAAPSAQKTLVVQYQEVADEHTYTPNIQLVTADAYAGIGIAYKVGPPDTAVLFAAASSKPRLVDRVTTPLPAGTGVVYGHSHLNESVTPQVFGRTLYLEKQLYLGRHDYIQHTVYNFSSYATLGSDEAWLLSENAWPIANIGGRISSGSTDFPGWTGAAGSGDAGLQAVTAGSHDADITGWGTALAGVGAVWVRPWREMNGNWTPWYTTTPANYVAAWRHMYPLLKAAAPSLQVIWCPAYSGTPDHTGMDYYPGDAYVDWVGIDGYRTSPNFWDFASLFTPIHSVFGPGGSNATQKPLIVCETSTATTTGTIDTPDPVTWIEGIAATVASLPGYRALCFWEETPHPLTLPEGAATDVDAAYLSLIRSAYLNPDVTLAQVPGLGVPASVPASTGTINLIALWNQRDRDASIPFPVTGVTGATLNIEAMWNQFYRDASVPFPITGFRNSTIDLEALWDQHWRDASIPFPVTIKG